MVTEFYDPNTNRYDRRGVTFDPGSSYAARHGASVPYMNSFLYIEGQRGGRTWGDAVNGKIWYFNPDVFNWELKDVRVTNPKTEITAVFLPDSACNATLRED